MAFILIAVFAGWQIRSWPLRLRYPGEQNFAEGIPLAEMLHLKRGVPIYAPPSSAGFDAANYGPLYYLLGAGLVDPRAPAYRPLRLISLLALVGCAAECGLLAFWLTRRRAAAGLGFLLFLSYAFVTSHGTSARCDLVALGLAFSGFLVAYWQRETPSVLWAVPLILLSIFYKQQFVAGPVSVLLFLLLEKRTRLAAAFCGLLGAGGLGLICLFQLVVFRGQAFFKHFVAYNVLPFSWTMLGLGFQVFGLVVLIPLLMAFEFLRGHPNRLLGCYVGVAAVLSLVTAARAGSDTHYFLEGMLVVSSLFAALLAERTAAAALPLDILVLLGVSLFLGQWFAPSPPRPEDFAQDRAVEQYLRRNFAPGTPALGYYAGDLVRAGLETPFSNLYHYTWLVRRKIFTERELPDQIHARRFGVIVLNFDLEAEKNPNRTDYYLTGAMRRAIGAGYRLGATLEMPRPERLHPEDRFYVWVPRESQPRAGPSSGPKGATDASRFGFRLPS